MNTYDVGDVVRCTGTFTDVNETPVDPTAVIFTVRDPGGNETSYTYGVGAQVVRVSAGIYYVDVTIDEAGEWCYRWASTGTGQAAGEKWFFIQASRFS